MKTIVTYVFFCVLHSVKLKKLFPIVRIVLEYGHCVCTISLHIWNVYLLPPELLGLECDPYHIILRFPFYNRTKFIFIVTILFSENVAKECTIVGMLYPV